MQARAAELEASLHKSYGKLQKSFARLDAAATAAKQDGALRGALEAALRESIVHISGYERHAPAPAHAPTPAPAPPMHGQAGLAAAWADVFASDGRRVGAAWAGG